MKKIILWFFTFFLIFFSLSANATVPTNGLVSEHLFENNYVDGITTLTSSFSNTAFVTGVNNIGASVSFWQTSYVASTKDFTSDISKTYSINGFFSPDFVPTNGSYQLLFRWSNSSGTDFARMYYGGYTWQDLTFSIWTQTFFTSYSFTPWQWYNISFQVDGTNNTYFLYIDGVLIKSWSATAPTLPSSYRLSIGNRFYNLNEWFNGDIDNFRLYNRVLSSSEVQDIYTSSQSISCSVPQYSYYIANTTWGQHYYCLVWQDYTQDECTTIPSNESTSSYITTNFISGNRVLYTNQNTNNCDNTEFIYAVYDTTDYESIDFYPPSCSQEEVQAWFDTWNAVSYPNVVIPSSVDGSTVEYWSSPYNSWSTVIDSWADFETLVAAHNGVASELTWMWRAQRCYASFVYNWEFFHDYFWYTATPPQSTWADGLNCWDLNGNGVFDISTEDINNDGIANAYDCQWPAGQDGEDGTSCQYVWDVVQNGVTGHQYTCDNYLSTQTIWDGVDGLNGTDGQSCTLSGSTITCGGNSFDISTLQGSDGYNCWDLNQNGQNDSWEDINNDTLYNVYDCRGEKWDKGDSGTLTLSGTGQIQVNSDLSANDQGFWGNLFGWLSNAMDGVGGAFTNALNNLTGTIQGIFGSGSSVWTWDLVEGEGLAGDFTYDSDWLWNLGSWTGGITGSVTSGFGGITLDNLITQTCKMFNTDGSFIYNGDTGFTFSYNLVDESSVWEKILWIPQQIIDMITNPINNVIAIFRVVGTFDEGELMCYFWTIHTVEYQKYIVYDDNINSTVLNPLNAYKVEKWELTFLDYFVLWFFGTIFLGIGSYILSPKE